MCSIASIEEYKKQKQWLDDIANIFPDISQLVTWWDAREYHIFPAFRCFGYSNVTLAESSNAMFKCHTQLWLLEAAQDNTSTMLTQINEFYSLLAQATSSSGKGTCSLPYDRANRSTQICAAKAYVAEFSNKHAQCKAIEEKTNPQEFLSSGGTRHRPVKTKTGIEGIFVQKIKQKKAAVNKNMHIGLGRKLNEAKAILAKDDVPIGCSPPLYSGTASGKFPRGCSSCYFRCKEVPWL